MAGVACVIPALDAARTLARVVRGVRNAIPGVRVIVVDDGSGDGTADVAAGCADRLERFARNQGKGAALRAGFAWALDGGATTILTMDADGQHDPAAAPRLVAALSAADIVIGARRRRGTSMPIVRRASNAVSAAAVSLCAGQWLADSQSGFRALRVRVLALVVAAGDRYEYETDFLIQAGRAGLRIVCVPVPTIYGAPSHFRAVGDTARVLRTICRRLPVGTRWSAGPVAGAAAAAGTAAAAGKAAPMAVAGPPAAAT